LKPDLYEPALNPVYAATLAHYGVISVSVHFVALCRGKPRRHALRLDPCSADRHAFCNLLS
jgi:hypothetical protein